MPFFPRLRDNIRVLRETHAYMGQAQGSGQPPEDEWLLDDFHAVMAQMQALQEGLPRRYFRDLPILTQAHLAGLPRIYAVAWEFVAHTDSAFDEGLLLDFLNAYQLTQELTLGELWALLTNLRVVLIENLRRLAERMASAQAAREAAQRWCDALQATGESALSGLAPLRQTMRRRGVERAFVLQVVQRMGLDAAAPSPPGPGNSGAALLRLRQALAQDFPDLAGAQRQQGAEQAADQRSLRHAITSLRLLADTDWRGLVDRSSLLIREMQACATFRAEHDDTQGSSLRQIERLARRSGHSESAVARALLALMQAPAPGQAVAAPVQAPGYWLNGPGSHALHQQLGLGASWRQPSLAQRQRWTLWAYLSSIVGLSTGLSAWWLWRAEAPHVAAWGGLWALALWPASETVIAVVHRLISESLAPRPLPRLALADAIPPEHRVLVVIPAMLTTAAGVPALVRQLELHYLANSERCAQFALLSDFVDADAAVLPADGALLQQAIAALDALEARHSQAPLHGAARRFLLLQRERQWAATEQCWSGWERKRGKIEQLIALLSGHGQAAFLDLGERSLPASGTQYVLTLDSDTCMPPGSLRALVGVAAHPLNRPLVDAALGRVVSGYGILQPRITTPLQPPETATPFHWLFAGQCGVDPYSAAVSEIYQDLFAEGTYCGKGLLHVAAMQAVLSGRLPQGQILSHDLLEGALARCAGVSDITLIEEAPLHADVAASRIHRWTRGDWQLWPVLRQPRRFPLRTINRWKMLDNLRRSLVAPASLALLLACLAGSALSPWSALALVLLAFTAGPLLGALAALAPSRDDLALGYFYRQALADGARALGTALWHLATLLQQGMLQLHAIACALWRTLVSRRRLLQWTTAASAQAAASIRLPTLAWRHAPVTLAAVLVWAVLPWSPWITALCALWAATPWWVWLCSRPWGRPPAAPSTLDRAYLLGIARDTWQFFARHVGPQSHHLPPDNVQTEPHLMVAQRTSPTNIGMYLLSVACAQRFGWISTPELLDRCEKTLTTLAALPRHRGHFLNWYDTATLAVLAPAYVSTVDSGNLCGHLIAVAGACEEMALAHQDSDGRRLLQLAARCRALALEASFGFLYDARRKLLHIGYRVDAQVLDLSCYDLMASEARLASLWAIAKADVPPAHWAALGRPFFAVHRHAGLRSWSGSMFEYTMPALVIAEPVGSVLHSAAQAAIREQRRFARGLDLPWGVSESAYAVHNQALAYQYASQGVPRLALRRTPPQERVVAPYASALAAMFAPTAAAANLRWLERLDARGEMGFIEALDFTAERQTSGSTGMRVHTFMAHHQGMSLVALANVLLDGAPRRWTMGDARISAVASLLQERLPREVLRLQTPAPTHSGAGRATSTPAVARAPALTGAALQPHGRYRFPVRAKGAQQPPAPSTAFASGSVSRDRSFNASHAHAVHSLKSGQGQMPSQGE